MGLCRATPGRRKSSGSSGNRISSRRRKAAAVTPLDRIAKGDGHGDGHLECYVNDDWRESGMASVQVLGQAPDGRYAHAAFLVDVWCTGLKDAYGYRTTLRADFEDHLDRMGEALTMVRVPAAEAKQLVAGGIRFSRQNGFKLPPHYDRWVTIFGPAFDPSAADLTDFGADGGLRYVGTEEFLRRRLAGGTVEEFLARADVEWVTADGLPRELLDLVEGEFEDEQDDEAVDPTAAGLDLSDAPLLAGLAKTLGQTGDRAEEAVLRWCQQTGRAPHPRLREALNTLLVSVLPAAMYADAAASDPESANPSELPDPDEVLEMNLEVYPSEERRSIEDALRQVKEIMGEFKNPTAMLASLESSGGDASSPPP